MPYWMGIAREMRAMGIAGEWLKATDDDGKVSDAVHQVLEANRGRDVIAVAHGGTIRAALALALDLEPEAALAFTIENCSITRIDRIDGPGMGHGWRVVRVNQPPR